MSNCISCGTYIPEGEGFVCPSCSKGTVRITIAIDPGESIGITYRVTSKSSFVYGQTITGKDRLQLLWEKLTSLKPDVIVYEEFASRQSAAKKLVGNKFVTCEVIGVIKLYAQLTNCRLVPLIPANKEFCGFTDNPKDPHFKEIAMLPGEKITEHTRDAYRLLRFAELFR